MNQIKIIKYEHRSEMVYVQKRLKGTHKDACLCYCGCVNFKPNNTENCSIAQDIFNTCVRYNITAPVYECPEFRTKDEQ